VVGYNVYRRASGGSYAKINPSVSATTSYTDTSVQSGTTYDYVTTAIDSSNEESAYSNQATATIP
jgi:fibronectin type 3 domain-containing protein